jgi:hypothetical protein
MAGNSDCRKHKYNLWTCYILCKILVFSAVTMKNAVFWDVATCWFCENRRFGGTEKPT